MREDGLPGLRATPSVRGPACRGVPLPARGGSSASSEGILRYDTEENRRNRTRTSGGVGGWARAPATCRIFRHRWWPARASAAASRCSRLFRRAPIAQAPAAPDRPVTAGAGLRGGCGIRRHRDEAGSTASDSPRGSPTRSGARWPRILGEPLHHSRKRRPPLAERNRSRHRALRVGKRAGPQRTHPPVCPVPGSSRNRWTGATGRWRPHGPRGAVAHAGRRWRSWCRPNARGTSRGVGPRPGNG